MRPWTPAERIRFCERMWTCGWFEGGVLAAHVLRPFAAEFGAKEFRAFERWIDKYVNNWAHCDGVASWLLAACIHNDRQTAKVLRGWVRSRNPWKRRASIVGFLQEAKAGRSVDDIQTIAMALRDDQDPMVLKGVGWVLKELYVSQPDATLAFLLETPFPGIVRRCAAEKMSAADKAALRGRAG